MDTSAPHTARSTAQTPFSHPTKVSAKDLDTRSFSDLNASFDAKVSKEEQEISLAHIRTVFDRRS